jgi:hypothetical protein
MGIILENKNFYQQQLLMSQVLYAIARLAFFDSTHILIKVFDTQLHLLSKIDDVSSFALVVLKNLQ